MNLDYDNERNFTFSRRYSGLDLSQGYQAADIRLLEVMRDFLNDPKCPEFKPSHVYDLRITMCEIEDVKNPPAVED
jgi:hypothetical protein